MRQPSRLLRIRRVAALACATCAVALLGTPRSADAATILIDFNDDATAVAGWNTFHTGNDGTTQALILDDGSASGFTLTLPTFNDSANPGWNFANALPSWAPASVADDYSFFNAFFDGGSQTAQFVLGNLDPGLSYSIDILMARNLNRDQDVTITHGGGVAFYDNWNTQADGWVAGNLLSVSGLTADAANEIVIDMRREGTSAAFNAIRITAVPEPAPTALLLLGVVVAVLARRSRS